MRKVQTPSGPFAFRLYFEDLGEIDKICLEALSSQSLLPSEPAPIRIERFVEKQFKAPLSMSTVIDGDAFGKIEGN